MQFQLGKNCEIVEPRFHDGSVVSLDTSDDKCAIIGLQTIQGIAHTLILQDLLGFRCTNYHAGNIILSVQIISNTLPPEGFVRFAFGTDDGGHDAHTRGILEKIEQGDLTLCSILPSYGCELHAVCHSIEMKTGLRP